MDRISERLLPQISLRDAMKVLFRYKWRAFLGFAFVLAIAVMGILFAPRTYMSEARLVVRLGRESVTLDPTAVTGTTLPVSDSRESELQTALDMLSNRRLYERVVESLGAQTILKQRLPDATVAAEVASEPAAAPVPGLLESSLQHVKSLVSDEVPDEEEAIKRLQSWISYGAEKRSTVIWIRCFSAEPELSQRVLQLFMSAYLDEHMRTHRTPQSQEFFMEQENELRQRLLTANGELRDAKNKLGVVSIENERSLIQKQFDSLNTEANTTKAELESTRNRIVSIRRDNPDLQGAELDRSGSSLTNDAIDQMRARLYELQLRERDMATRYTEAHPMRKSMKRQLAEAERILALQELAIETSRAEALQSKSDSLARQLLVSRDRLQELNRGEINIQQLENQVELLKKSLATYTENREVARIGERLAGDHITNIRQVQEPSLQHKAVSPRKSVVAILGLMAACLAGIGLPVASSLLDSTLGTPEHLRSELDLPVLLAVPRTPRSRLLMK